MIGVIFNFGTEVVEVRVKDNNVFFRTSNSQQFGDIDGIKLDKVGVLKEHPDLKDREDWKQEARKRFKQKIKQMDNENEQIKYVIEDLSHYGYVATHIQKQGFRPIRIK